jgi:hypothetical protein
MTIRRDALSCGQRIEDAQFFVGWMLARDRGDAELNISTWLSTAPT